MTKVYRVIQDNHQRQRTWWSSAWSSGYDRQHQSDQIQIVIYINTGKTWSIPLPHYIRDIKNAEQYQPITADPSKYWSVASPTATLHFTHQLINEINSKGVAK